MVRIRQRKSICPIADWIEYLLYRKPKKKKNDSKEKTSFSKIVLSCVMATYFIGLFYGMFAVDKILVSYPEYAIQALIALFGYIGTPISVSIGFYSWKSKHENVLKIGANGQIVSNDMSIENDETYME